ncbi:hypothetical protein Kpol_1010p8 [Vanderwaltozyma polyspora DSM 70294]|uniref:PSP proline-rich domain-containing protein n=1 Tax=Vanderwaltozyma polyspora (strain ATCC 22028 / DSM 70294 / BCRC 21397 / CBS 2163 / NBRC 10782 / NRRL Y-8283 / UCD 57-17) TaxID=436907 RepID=A7TIF6_VANPO|nr:uncharacterized protein Kpol_1010p8 [Vanderwaltozyma polyspora DSM 70294]EDO17894.1 hypothetical protein Kpol_1010p8 [Vanderwaltozyma polyspora DSM 70294]
MARKSKQRSKGKSLHNKKTSFDKENIAKALEERIANEKVSTDSAVNYDDTKDTELKDTYKDLFARFEVRNKDSKVDKNLSEVIESENLINEENEEDNVKDEFEADISKRKIRKLSKPTLAGLKTSVPYPQVIEWYDCDALNPYFLASIKSSKNIVPVPDHWQTKKEYLSGRSMLGKKPFELPELIKQTGIEEMRNTLPGKQETDESLKELSRARMQPKLGSLDLDYKKLHDVFFKLGADWKPELLLGFGDLYYERRNLQNEEQWKNLKKSKEPGLISDELRKALNIQEGQLPPWCIKMNKIGLPPNYPNFKIAGINWDITNFKNNRYGSIAKTAHSKRLKKRRSNVFGALFSAKGSESENILDVETPQPDVDTNGNKNEKIENIEEYGNALEPIQQTPSAPLETTNKEDDKKQQLYTVLMKSSDTNADKKSISDLKYEIPGKQNNNEEKHKLESKDHYILEGNKEEQLEEFRF